MAKKLEKNILPEAKEGQILSPLSTYKEKMSVKEQRPLSFIPSSPAVQNALKFKGLAISHTHSVSGYSDTGKTTLLLEWVIACQKMNILPVLVITEGKFQFEHAKTMGMECDYEEVVDESTGELKKNWNKGFFLFRDDFENLEEMYQWMATIAMEVNKPKSTLPYDICFFVDSQNKLKCKQAIEKIMEGESDLPMHNAKVHKNYFSGIIEPLVVNSKYTKNPHTITFVSILRGHKGIDSPNLQDSGGTSLYYDMAIKFHCGGKLAAATKDKVFKMKNQTIAIAKETKLRILKNHINGISAEGSVLMTQHGFIELDDWDDYLSKNKKTVEEHFKIVLDNGEIE